MKINLVSTNKYENTLPRVFIDTIEAAHQLFKDAGFDVAISVNYFNKDAVNILWGAGTHKSHDLDEIRGVFDKKSTVIFNMEQIGSGSPLITDDYINFLKNYVVFDYNQHNVIELNIRGILHAHEFPLQPMLNDRASEAPLETTKEYDLAFYGSINERRVRVFKQLESNGIKIKYVGGVYGEDLSESIKDCKAVLNIHYYENSNIFESPRCLQPIAMGIPVYSEDSKRPIGFDWEKNGVFFARKEFLIHDLVQMTKIQATTNHNKGISMEYNFRARKQLSFIISKVIGELNMQSRFVD